MVMYVDDAQFLDSDYPGNSRELKARIENSLSFATKWYTQNRLRINPSKTEMILLKSRRQNASEFSVFMGDCEIVPSPYLKILGVTVDACLMWEKHISIVVQRSYSVLIGLARMRRRIPREVKKLLIEALVFPHVRYCMTVWGGGTTTQLKGVQKCINFGARIAMDLMYCDRVSAALKELGWKAIKELIAERDVHFMYQLIHDTNAPTAIRQLITDRSEVSCRATRAMQNGELQVLRARTEFARRSFLCRATRACNQLPVGVRRASTLRMFKTTLDEAV